MIVTAVQPNGERILLEWWVYQLYLHGQLTDPFLLAPILRAVLLLLPLKD